MYVTARQNHARPTESHVVKRQRMREEPSDSDELLTCMLHEFMLYCRIAAGIGKCFFSVLFTLIHIFIYTFPIFLVFFHSSKWMCMCVCVFFCREYCVNPAASDVQEAKNDVQLLQPLAQVPTGQLFASAVDTTPAKKSEEFSGS